MNVLCQLSDEALLRALEEAEIDDPSVASMDDHGLIYTSRRMGLDLSGLPILIDFGQMCYGEEWNTKWSMPDLYRAPEVLLKLPWSYPVDVWSVAVMLRRIPCVTPMGPID